MAIPERWLDSACHPGPGLGPAMRRARGQEIGQIGDASAAIEAVVPLARIARQMLGADAVEGAVEPGLHVAERVGFILRISFLIENQRPAAHRSVLAVATGCAGR